MLPFRVIDLDDGRVCLHFFQSTQPYYLNIKSAKGAKYLSILRDAKKTKSLVTVNVYDKSNDIAEVVLSPSALSVAYRKKLHSSTKTTSLRKMLDANASTFTDLNTIIPSLDSLNALYAKMQDPFISFAYAVDGCFGRAHWMRKILNENGYECDKVFAFGHSENSVRNLSVTTPSNCCVNWYYHVAPIVKYLDANNSVVEVVFDPSLFNAPIPLTTWAGKLVSGSCGNGTTNATSVDITRFPGNIYIYMIDPPYNDTWMTDDWYGKAYCINASYNPFSGCVNLNIDVSNCFPPNQLDY